MPVWYEIAAEVFFAATFLLVLASALEGLLIGFFKRISATALHRLWLTTFVALFLLPFLIGFLQKSPDGAIPRDSAALGSTPIAIVWFVGFIAVNGMLVWGIARNAVFKRTVSVITDATTLRESQALRDELRTFVPAYLRCSSEPVCPVTWGILRPIVILPHDWQRWSDARRRWVLRYELTLIKRFDEATQEFACFVRAIYWFHPLAWYAVHRLQMTRDEACDERIVWAGIDRREHAKHLRSMHRQYRVMTIRPAITITRRRGLARRLSKLRRS